MGILYEDDISKEPISKEDAFIIEITRFDVDGEGNTKIRKSQKLYVSLGTLRKTFGDRNFGWTTLVKNSEGKWIREVGN